MLVFYSVFSALKIPGALGWSIILITVSIRLLLTPLTLKQMKSLKKLTDIKPHLDDLSKKHAGDKRKLQEEQLKLYQKHGINPAAGCLPALIQIPVFIALYNVFMQILGNNSIAAIIEKVNHELYPQLNFIKIQTLNLSFFGIDLTVKPNQWKTYGIWLLAIPIVTGLLQWWQTKVTMTGTPNKTKAVAVQGKGGDDFSKAMQTQTTVILPVMIGFFAYSFPLGLALYWNTFSLFAIIQQRFINKK